MKLGERKEPQKTFWALRFGLWMVVMIIGAFVYFHYNPILIENEPIAFKPYRISRSLKSDIAIVVDYDAIENSGDSFDTIDWSAVWIDTFEQEIGPLTIATPQTLTQAILQRSRVLVLTSSVANSVPDPIISKIRERVREGMIVVLERPAGKLRETFSADGKGELRKSTAISFGPTFGPDDQNLKKIPLFGSYVASIGSRPDSQTFLAFNGAPTIYSTPIGDGFALTVEFEFGKQILALQQGKPADDFQLKKTDDLRSFYKTQDLVAAPELIASTLPLADLLERTLVWKAIGSLTPIAAIWPFPQDADGVLLFVHDDKSLGQQAFWMNEMEEKEDAKATFLFSYNALGKDFSREDNEIGFLWDISNDSPDHLEKMGILGWEPLARPMGIFAQHKSFLKSASTKRITTSAISDARWMAFWDEPFRQLTQIKVRIDTSYEVENSSGYHFGTGFPFLTMSQNGIPTGMREQAIVFPYGATRGQNLEVLLENSQTNLHQPISTRIPANAFTSDLDPEKFQAWIKIFENARKYNHTMMSIGSYDRFLRARRVAEMRSRFEEKVPLPELPKAPKDEKEKKVVEQVSRFRVTINAKRTDHAIVVPEIFGDKRIIAVREKSTFVDGREVARVLKSQEVQMMGNLLRKIPVPRGFSTVDVFYQ